MNEIRINEINKEIGYPEGHIYWNWCKGYTSKLIQRLYKVGYYAVKSGAIYIFKDKEGKEVTTGYSWEGMLKNVAILMR